MARTWTYLTLLGLLLPGSPALPPAAAQVQTSGDIQAYGNQTATYGVGCGGYNVIGYLKGKGAEATPTTREDADAVYTLKGTRAEATADLTSMGKVTTNGSGLTGSFLQTQTVTLSLKGAFENCPGTPFFREYTGSQKLDAATVPGGGPGELNAYGEQAVTFGAVCESVTVRPMDKGASGNAGSQDALNSRGNSGQSGAGGASAGRLSFDLDCTSRSEVTRTGGMAGSYTQSQSMKYDPNGTGQAAAGLTPGVSGTTIVTVSQNSAVKTGN